LIDVGSVLSTPHQSLSQLLGDPAKSLRDAKPFSVATLAGMLTRILSERHLFHVEKPQKSVLQQIEKLEHSRDSDILNLPTLKVLTRLSQWQEPIFSDAQSVLTTPLIRGQVASEAGVAVDVEEAAVVVVDLDAEEVAESNVAITEVGMAVDAEEPGEISHVGMTRGRIRSINSS